LITPPFHESFEDAQLPMPEFRNISDGFMVTVYSEKSSRKDFVENGKQNYSVNVGINVGKDVVKDVVKDLSEIQNLIIDLISTNPGITIKEIASRLNLTTRTIDRNIAILKKANLLSRQNGRKEGFWEPL
jgi:ATP-dependent DNA helicase RecG